MIEKKNYYGIDLLKFIMAVCVVAIHTQPLYSVQSIVVQRLFDTITSLAVPYFFSVSGFLLFSKIDADISCRKNMEVCKRYLSRVLSLYVIWNIIYLPITIFGFKENNMSFARYVLDCIRGFLFIGQQFYSWQLWYLLSVFFVIASICIMAEHKIKDKNIFKIMMAIFLMGGGIGVLTTVDFSEYRKIEMVIKCIKFIFGNGRILSGFGYIAVGWIVAKKKILSGRISIILGLILLGALYLAGDTWGFLLKFLIAEILLSASCKVTLPQHPIWEHMRYVSEIIYFTHMWVAFSYTLIFREFRYYGADIFFASTLIPMILYYILYRSHMLSKVKTIL